MTRKENILKSNERGEAEDLRTAHQGTRFAFAYLERSRELQNERKRHHEDKKNNPQEDMLFIQK